MIFNQQTAMQTSHKALLVLENGDEFEASVFGAARSTAGEIVFNTAMTGYPESLTDPSYTGQILCFTFPLIGNYGVPSEVLGADGIAQFLESERIHPRAIVVSDYSANYSHWNAAISLSDYLSRHNVVGLSGIDTRELTKRLRERGSMKAKIIIDGNDVDFVDPNADNLVEKVSCHEVIKYGSGTHTVVLLDCGVKHNIIRCLLKRDVNLIRVPWDYDISTLNSDALFISNGPGDPDRCGIAVEHIRQYMTTGKPIFGICLGNQLLAKAGGASTYKLKYGHRSHNQPVRRIGTNKCYITSQNHGYAVDERTLGTDWESLYVNMNDQTNEGIRHKSRPYFSVQFHPEAASGPTDTAFLFDEFVELIKQSKQ